MESPLEVLSRAAVFIENHKTKDMTQTSAHSPSSALKILPGRSVTRAARHREYVHTHSARADKAPSEKTIANSSESVIKDPLRSSPKRSLPEVPVMPVPVTTSFEAVAADAAAAMAAAAAAQRLLARSPDYSALLSPDPRMIASALSYVSPLTFLPGYVPWTLPALSPLASSISSQASPSSPSSTSALHYPNLPSNSTSSSPTSHKPPPPLHLAKQQPDHSRTQQSDAKEDQSEETTNSTYNHKKFGASRKELATSEANSDSIDEHFRRSLGKYPEAVKSLNKSEPSATCGSVDDHFAKSLGANWQTQCSSAKALHKDSSSSPRDSTPASRTAASLDFDDTVDDHFTKALGDTWLKIKAEHEAEGSELKNC